LPLKAEDITEFLSLSPSCNNSEMAGKKAKRKQHISKRPAPRKSTMQLLKPLALVMAIFGITLYLNTLGHDYVLDDFSVIKENFVTKKGIEGIPTIWKTHARYGYWNSPGELYRPIPMSLFAIEWELAPDQPWLSHLINILLYGLSGAVMLLLFARWLKGYHLAIPVLATAFFLAHPVHVEVVANIKSRDEILMLLFSMLSLYALWNWLEKAKAKHLVLAMVFYLVALFSKENAVTFVAIVPLALFFFAKAKTGKILSTTAMYAAAALFFILVRKAVIGDLLDPGGPSVLDNFLVAAKDTSTYMASAFLLVGKYLQTLLVPHPLSHDWGYNQIPLTGWGDWRVLLTVAVVVGLGFVAIKGLKKRSLWAFAILFFAINFSIFSNLIITIGSSYGDRFLYSSSPAFALALALGFAYLFNLRIKSAPAQSMRELFKPKSLWMLAALLLAVYSIKTYTRNMDWKDSYTLYDADIRKAPKSAKLNFHYGIEIVQKGLDEKDPEQQKAWYQRANEHFLKAIEIYPSYHDAYGQLGLAMYRQGNKEKALEYYQQALKYKPNFPLVYSNMGIIYFERGDLAKAKECYQNAVKYDPRMVDALRNLGAVYAMEKNFPEAIKWFSQALQYAPDDPVINKYLGSAYRDNGQPELGKPYLEKAERLK